MITQFEEITQALTTEERDLYLPIIRDGLKLRVGAKYAIRNKTICTIMLNKGYTKITEARVRKIINAIRMEGLVPHLVANSKGYYVATSVKEVEDYCKGLEERAKAIWAVRGALLNQLSGNLFL